MHVTLRKARKLLPHVRCGAWRGHKRHVWEDRRSTSEHRFTFVYCDGVHLGDPETKAERAEHQLRERLAKAVGR